MKSLLVLCLLLTACATTPKPPSGRFEGSGIRTTSPTGYARTCAEHPEQEFCRAELEAVNRHFNAMPFKYEIGDDWMPITKKGGDCDSYATAKYNRLVELGWPKSALRLATCCVSFKKLQYHVVLFVDLNGKTLVLDNAHPDLWTPAETGYTFHKIQIPGTQKWEGA